MSGIRTSHSLPAPPARRPTISAVQIAFGSLTPTCPLCPLRTRASSNGLQFRELESLEDLSSSTLRTSFCSTSASTNRATRGWILTASCLATRLKLASTVVAISRDGAITSNNHTISPLVQSSGFRRIGKTPAFVCSAILASTSAETLAHTATALGESRELSLVFALEKPPQCGHEPKGQ